MIENLCLQFFAEGSAESGAQGAMNSGLTGDFETDYNTHVLKKTGTAAVSHRANKTDSAAPVQQTAEQNAPAAGEQTKAEEQPRDLDKEFGELIKGEYKQPCQRYTQRIINERFKEGKQAEQVKAEYEDALAFVYEKYGVKNGDLAALKTAIESDESLVAEEAARRHLPKGQVLLEKQMAKVTQKQQADNMRAQQEEANRRQWNTWQQQAAEAAKVYPGLDLRAEITGNARFGELLDKGLSVREAYENVHFSEISQRLAQQAVQDAAAKTARSIAANGQRPAEGSLGARPGVAVNKSVDSLTGKDIDNILRRVSNGEKVTF